MRSSLARHFIALPVVAAAGLVVVSAEAAPPTSCQNEAPVHTLNLGGKDDVSITSSKAYWENDCKCFVVQIDVPANAAPATPASFAKPYRLNAGGTNLPKDTCATTKQTTFVYKKDGADWKLINEKTAAASLEAPPFSSSPNPADRICMTHFVGDIHQPSATAQSYRVLVRIEAGGKHFPASAGARHEPATPTGPGPH